MIKKRAILLIVDLLLMVAWVWHMHPDPSVSIVLLLIVPILFFVNIIAGLGLKLLKHPWGAVVLLNSLMAPIVFYFLFTAAISREVAYRYKSFYYELDGQHYEIGLDLMDGDYGNNSRYEFYRRGEGSSWE